MKKTTKAIVLVQEIIKKFGFKMIYIPVSVHKNKPIEAKQAFGSIEDFKRFKEPYDYVMLGFRKHDDT